MEGADKDISTSSPDRCFVEGNQGCLVVDLVRIFLDSSVLSTILVVRLRPTLFEGYVVLMCAFRCTVHLLIVYNDGRGCFPMHYDIYFGLFMIFGKKSPKMTDKFSFDLHKANERKKNSA